MSAGKFIVFEGLDGSGKTTQAKEVTKRLNDKGKKTIYTNEPTDGEIGKLIRKALSGESEVSKHALALLFAADRLEHIDKLIIEHIKRGENVICDRFVFSSIAYQGLDVRIEDVTRYNMEALNRIQPDIIFFLDTPVDICLERIKAERACVDLFENKTLLDAIYKNYQECFNALASKDSLFIIDGNNSTERISELIIDKIDTQLFNLYC